MDDEQELRNRMEAVDAPSSRIEIDALLQAGRRRAFRRRSVRAAGGVGLATAVLLAVPSILNATGASPAPREDVAGASPTTSDGPVGPCQMTELPVPPGMSGVEVEAVDPTGRYIVGNSTVGQNFRPVLWVDEKPSALPVIATSVQVTAVNASGVVVGLAHDLPDEYVFRYENGAYTRLRTPPGEWHVYPTPAINAAGDIVINAEPRGKAEGEDSIVLLWKAGSTTATQVPLPTEANVYDITDDGTLVGGTYEKGYAAAAYTWDQSGKPRKLEMPGGEKGIARAARGEWVTGSLSLAPARWNLRTGEVTKLGPPLPPDALDKDGPGPGVQVNASGWVVTGSPRGSLLREGDPIDLVVPAGQASDVKGVSDTGLVVGQARDKNHSILGPRTWRC
ncbi:hypothetical protein K1W54_34545 [Micromonospora sp. CPCC 205371]|nr:hypothetical protein [Micromonospora sp. CPCC 205371]